MRRDVALETRLPVYRRWLRRWTLEDAALWLCWRLRDFALAWFAAQAPEVLLAAARALGLWR